MSCSNTGKSKNKSEKHRELLFEMMQSCNLKKNAKQNLRHITNCSKT